MLKGFPILVLKIVEQVRECNKVRAHKPDDSNPLTTACAILPAPTNPILVPSMVCV